MHRSLRAQLQQIESHGLSVVRVDQGKHYKVRIRARDGREMMLVMHRTGSDWRAARNQDSTLRAFAKGQT